MLAGSHRNAWPDETGTGGRTNRNTHHVGLVIDNAVYVNELPLESVKLHPSVVRNIDQHLEQQLFVRGLIASYVGKGVRVIATGVELESEWLTLQKLGIAGGQGFYFSQPLNQIIAQGQIQ